jgi:chemotaxis protein methyltransferase CheR
VNDSECVEFLQWALPRMGMRWQGFRKVRRQVCRRLSRRLTDLRLADLRAYRSHLEGHAEEWAVLDELARITISRFNRDRGVFAALQADVLPALATAAVQRGSGTLEAWSAGCASGVEAYTLAIMWQLELAPRFPALALRVLATDLDEAMIARAQRGLFSHSSLKELPGHWREAAFAQDGGLYRLRDAFKEPVALRRHDVRDPPPDRGFDLVMCRNLAFTYFAADLQRATAGRLAGSLKPGGALVLGAHETLPDGVDTYEPWSFTERIYRRTEVVRP